MPAQLTLSYMPRAVLAPTHGALCMTPTQRRAHRKVQHRQILNPADARAKQLEAYQPVSTILRIVRNYELKYRAFVNQVPV